MERLQELFPKLSFESELAENEELRQYIEKECIAEMRIAKLEIERRSGPAQMDYSNIVMVLGLPVFESKKLSQFKSVITKVMDKLQVRKFDLVNEMQIPVGENNKTFGTMFLKCTDKREAIIVAQKLDQVKFVKNVFKTILLQDYVSNLHELSQSSEVTPLTNRDLKQWMLEPKCEQFLVHFANRVECWWNTHISDTINTDPEKVFPIGDTQQMSASIKKVQWSPQGTYLIVLTDKGCSFHGGPDFAKFREFSHYSLDGIKISQCERYLITYNKFQTASDAEEEIEKLIIWDITEEKELRTFPSTDKLEDALKISIDDIDFSNSGKFVSIKYRNLLKVFETPEMNMIIGSDNRRTSLKLEDLKHYKWSPCEDQIVTLRQSRQSNKPAFIEVIEIPSRDRLFSHPILNLKSCQFEFANEGNALAIIVEENSAINYKLIFLLFDKRKVSMSKMEVNAKILDFKFQPTSCVSQHSQIYFGLIKRGGAPASSQKEFVQTTTASTFISFHVLLKEKNNYCIKDVLDPANPSGTRKLQATNLHWNPKGKFVVASNLQGKSTANIGAHTFFCIKNMKLHQIQNITHQASQYCQWDSTGRFFSTFYAVGREGVKDDMYSVGYQLYNCFGEPLYLTEIPKFHSFQWRPRPDQILSEKKMKELHSNESLIEYRKHFKELDLIEKNARSKLKRETKRTVIQKFIDEYLAPKLEKHENEREKREQILGKPEFEEDNYVCLELIEEEIIEEQTKD